MSFHWKRCSHEQPAPSQPESAPQICPKCRHKMHTDTCLIGGAHGFEHDTCGCRYKPGAAPSVQQGPSVEAVCVHCSQIINWQGRYAGWESCAQGYWFSSATGSGCPKSDYGHERLVASASSEREAALEAKLQTVRETLEPTYVLLEALRVGTEWELAPSIKAEIARLAPQVAALLGQIEGEGK